MSRPTPGLITLVDAPHGDGPGGPPAGGTWATSTLRSATATSPVIVLGPEGTVPPPPSVAELLGTDALGIGAVVPAVVSRHGQLLEAGADRVDGRLVPIGAGQDPLLSAFRMRRDAAGTTYPWVAVRRELLGALDLDPGCDDLQTVVSSVLATVTGCGRRIAYEPSWRVVAETPSRSAGTPGAPGAGTAASNATRVRVSTMATTAPGSDRGTGPDVLIVSGFVPGDPFRLEDRALWALVADLAEHVEGARLTLLAADGFRAEPAAETFRRAGVEVVYGPVAWVDWFSANRARFSHIFLTWTGLQSDLASWIQRTQTQATTTLYLPSLPFRDLDLLRPCTAGEELPGLECVRADVELHLATIGKWVEAAWCEQEGDAAYLRGLPSFPAVSVVSPAPPERVPITDPAADPEPVAARRGVVLLASEGHDVVKANEDAALFALTEILPALRRHRPDLPVTVLSEAPTPRLETACGHAGAELLSLDQASRVIASAELMVVGHQYGTGGRVAILAALEAETPFVTTPVGANGLDLAGLIPHAMFVSTPDLIWHARRLLDDAAALDRFRAAARQLTSAGLSRQARLASLRAALPPLGLTPATRPQRAWPALPIPAQSRPPLLAPPLRPPGTIFEAGSDKVDLSSERGRYQEWHRRFGPNDSVLSALRAEVDVAAYRPLLSILMPVYNTDATLLREAIASVTGQIYDHWQLCLADDGSDRPETRAVLDDLRDDPAMVVVDLPGQSGIATATNAALAAATGEFVAFMDHDDLLKPHALAQVVRWLNADPSLDVIYTDEDKLDDHGEIFEPYLKPNWSPDLLRSNNYLSHLTVMRRSLVADLGGLRPAFDGSQDYDLVLRATEHTDRIAHIPEPLYSWRVISGSTAELSDAKPYALTAAKRALTASLERRSIEGRVETATNHDRYRTRYAIVGQPKVTIIIPTKNGADLLRRCIGSVLERSTYRNYELVVIDNQSTDGDTLGYLASTPARIVRYPHTFNYSRMLNLAAATAECDALLFLNNDTEIITPEWIESLLEHAMRPEVGAVGARLHFGDGRIQHEGILVGVGGWAGNIDHGGYWLLGELVRNTSAVTGACTMIRPSVYARLGGNDERLRVAYNDVDICLRVHQAGLQVVYTPYAELFHYESATRSGYEHETDGPLFGQRWEPRQRVDRYYSPVFDQMIPFRIGLEAPRQPQPS